MGRTDGFSEGETPTIEEQLEQLDKERYFLSYKTNVSINEIDEYTVDDFIGILKAIPEFISIELGKPYIKEAGKKELSIEEKVKKIYLKK